MGDGYWPQRYQVLISGTYNVSLFGKSVFADVNKLRIWRWRCHLDCPGGPQMPSYIIILITGR